MEEDIFHDNDDDDDDGNDDNNPPVSPLTSLRFREEDIESAVAVSALPLWYSQ